MRTLLLKADLPVRFPDPFIMQPIRPVAEMATGVLDREVRAVLFSFSVPFGKQEKIEKKFLSGLIFPEDGFY